MDFYDNDNENFSSRMRRIIDWGVDIIVVLALAWFFINSFCMQVTIPGQSMSPLLDPEDVVLVNKLTYDLSNPRRNDVVAFEREDLKINVIRIIGIPGDVVQIIDGWVYLNGEPLKDEELGAAYPAGLAESPVELGTDEYFLLGDNRDSSEDSRFTNIGNVRREQIIGKVWLRILPLFRIKLIRS